MLDRSALFKTLIYSSLPVSYLKPTVATSYILIANQVTKQRKMNTILVDGVSKFVLKNSGDKLFPSDELTGKMGK
jgi:hypothetical protein